MAAAMIYGRLVNFDSLRNFNMDVEPEIVAVGWKKFFQIRDPVYQNEVFDFWKNATMVENTIVSEIGGTSIIITEELIGKVTECPLTGEKLISKPKWMSQLKEKEAVINQQLYGENDPIERRASWLTPKARVLYAILFNCVLPRAGSRHLVTTLDEQCIFYLLNKKKVNLSHLIFQYMVKSIKDTKSYPYGMLLTRIFKESGVHLKSKPWIVKSSIDSTTIARMGLFYPEKDDAESRRKSRTEGEQLRKQTPTRRASDDSEGRIRAKEEDLPKRKGEPLLSSFPKQARRSPRVQTLRQQAEKAAREISHKRSTRSLVSILEEETARQTTGTGGKRKNETMKTSPRVIEPMVEDIVTQQEVRLETIIPAIQEFSLVSDNPSFEEIVPTNLQSLFVLKRCATLIVGQEVKQKVVDVMTNVPPKDLRFRRDNWVHRLVVREEKKTQSVIIRDHPKRFVKAYFKSVIFDNSLLPLLDIGYRNFYNQLKRVSNEPYPPEPSEERPTSYPILGSTLIKVVPDLQPPNFVELNFEKLKLKVQPEPVLDDLTSDQITEAVRSIDAACELQRNPSSFCVYQDPGTSQSKALDDDPVRGVLKECSYSSLKIGTLECSYFVMEIILRQRPLWDIMSFEEVLPWFANTCPRLPVPFDLDLPESRLPVLPPILHLIEQVEPTTDAYATTVVVLGHPHTSTTDTTPISAIVPAQSHDKEARGSAAELRALEKKIDKLIKGMKKVKRLLQNQIKNSGS